MRSCFVHAPWCCFFHAAHVLIFLVESQREPQKCYSTDTLSNPTFLHPARSSVADNTETAHPGTLESKKNTGNCKSSSSQWLPSLRERFEPAQGNPFSLVSNALTTRPPQLLIYQDAVTNSITFILTSSGTTIIEITVSEVKCVPFPLFYIFVSNWKLVYSFRDLFFYFNIFQLNRIDPEFYVRKIKLGFISLPSNVTFKLICLLVWNTRRRG